MRHRWPDRGSHLRSDGPAAPSSVSVHVEPSAELNTCDPATRSPPPRDSRRLPSMTAVRSSQKSMPVTRRGLGPAWRLAGVGLGAADADEVGSASDGSASGSVSGSGRGRGVTAPIRRCRRLGQIRVAIGDTAGAVHAASTADDRHEPADAPAPTDTSRPLHRARSSPRAARRTCLRAGCYGPGRSIDRALHEGGT